MFLEAGLYLFRVPRKFGAKELKMHRFGKSLLVADPFWRAYLFGEVHRYHFQKLSEVFWRYLSLPFYIFLEQFKKTLVTKGLFYDIRFARVLTRMKYARNRYVQFFKCTMGVHVET